MCLNEETSVAIYVLGCLGALYAWKSHNKYASFILAAITQMQLLEYLMWSDQSCGAMNEWASYAIIWVLYLHVVGQIVVAWLVHRKTRTWIRYSFPIITVLAYTVGSGFLTRDCSNQPELCSTKGSGDRLQWAPLTVLYDKSHRALFWSMVIMYFAVWPWTHNILFEGWAYPDVRLPVAVMRRAFALSIVLAVIWGGSNWWDIFGSVWCTGSALAGVICMAWYGWTRDKGSAWLISYKDDYRSLVTGHTLLHIASGYGVGAAANALDMGVQSSAFAAMAAILGWEVFEYWHAPAFGYWTVMHAGNTAVDISTGLWPFMVAHNVGWDTALWTYLLIVPGALLGHVVQCKAYEKPTRVEYSGRDRACLLRMYRARKWLYPKYLKGKKNFDKAVFDLDPYMAPSRAHRVLAYFSAIAVLLTAFVPEQAVPCLATFAFGYALGGPTIADAEVYKQWYRSMKCITDKCDGCLRYGCDDGCCGCAPDCLCKKRGTSDKSDQRSDAAAAALMSKQETETLRLLF